MLVQVALLALNLGSAGADPPPRYTDAELEEAGIPRLVDHLEEPEDARSTLCTSAPFEPQAVDGGCPVPGIEQSGFFQLPHRTAIYAPFDGVVSAATTAHVTCELDQSTYPVTFLHVDGTHASAWMAHVGDLRVRTGQKVKSGQRIARSTVDRCTGRASVFFSLVRT